MKKLLALVLMLALAISVVGCSAPAEETVSSTPDETSSSVPTEPESEAPESPVEDTATTVTDRAGNIIEVKDSYTKIVSYAPSITEKLVDLGYAGNIVAVTAYDMAQGLPEDVLVFDMMNPDLEQITALEPDLILTTNITAAGGEDPFTVLRDSGTTIATFPTANSISEIAQDIEVLGTLLSAESAAEAMLLDMTSAIAMYQEKSAEISEKKTVYFEIAAAPDMYSTGSGTFLNEIIEIVGGVNALGDQNSWIGVGEEQILTANPDVIFTNVTYIENAVDEILARNGWDVVTAVANGDVYYIDNSASSLPNHNIVKAMDEMAKRLYPEVYAE